MRSEADFPYNPRARIESLRDADKVRAIPDRELAGHMLRLLDAIENQPAPARAPRQLHLPRLALGWASCREVA